MLQKINSTLSLSDYCIILGDFNEHFFKPPKNGIINLLTFKDFYETTYIIHSQRNDPTWKCQNINRRLDMIWCSPKLATLLIHAAISNPQWIITDHSSVFCDLSSTSIIYKTPIHILKKWKTKRYAFITQNLPEETWQKYHNFTEILSTTSFNYSANNINSLWLHIKQIILKAANKFLKKKQLNQAPQPPKQFNLINKQLKLTIQTISLITQSHISVPNNIINSVNSNIILLNKSCLSLQLPTINWNTQLSISTLLTNLKQLKAQLRTQKAISAKQYKNFQINLAIQNNIKRFGNQHTLMLSNILEKQ